MPKLSTHILDTASGQPAAGVRIDLSMLDDDDYRLLKTLHTNSDGRTDELLLDAETMKAGQYELLFHVGVYFTESSTTLKQPPFLDQVPVRFTIVDASQNYHVPLLVSPWSYSIYRGS